jgi:FKBP12-rapamycin complex-associated protein
LLLRSDIFEEDIDPMWITQLSHWDKALLAQNKMDGGEDVSTFNSFNTRMICCTLAHPLPE